MPIFFPATSAHAEESSAVHVTASDPTEHVCRDGPRVIRTVRPAPRGEWPRDSRIINWFLIIGTLTCRLSCCLTTSSHSGREYHSSLSHANQPELQHPGWHILRQDEVRRSCASPHQFCTNPAQTPYPVDSSTKSSIWNNESITSLFQWITSSASQASENALSRTPRHESKPMRRNFIPGHVGLLRSQLRWRALAQM